MPNLKSLALIGIGKWGNNLARNFHTLGALHTICDIDESLLDNYQAKYPSVAFTSNFHKVFQNSAITKVAIATPSPTHYSLAKQALLAGKDVYVEKPLCLNLAEAEELVHLAKSKQRILMVGHILQYHPCILRLQELINNETLGDLHYIAAHRLNLGGVSGQKENVLWDLAPHDISVILSFCRQQPEHVHCKGIVQHETGGGITMTSMRFTPSLQAHIYASRSHPFKEHKLLVIGSSATAVFDDTKPWIDKLLIYRNQEGHQPVSEAIQISQSEPLQEECSHFLHCCRERITPKTDGEEALRVLQVLSAAQSSLEESYIDVEIEEYSKTS